MNNITKQQWTIIGVIVAVILVWYFFMRNKKVTKAESSGYTASTTKKCDCVNKTGVECGGYCGFCCQPYGGTKAAAGIPA